MLTTSKLLIALISLSFIVAFVVALPATFLIATRNLFAWSFDRILPDKVSEVGLRTHSPLVANLITLAVTLIYLALIVWGSSKFLEIFFTAGMAEILTFFVVAIAAVAFPFRRRALYDGSPIKRSVAGIPLLALVGAASLAVYALLLYPLATNDALGANTTTGWVRGRQAAAARRRRRRRAQLRGGARLPDDPGHRPAGDQAAGRRAQRQGRGRRRRAASPPPTG